MKKLLWLLGLGGFVLANNLSTDMVCKQIDKGDVEKAMGVVFKKAEAVKLPFEPPYDYSGCAYTDKVLPLISINYYYKSSASVYPPDSKVKELKGLKFPARVVYSKQGDVFEMIGDTKEGSKILLVFNYGIKDGGKKYNDILKLLERLVHVFK